MPVTYEYTEIHPKEVQRLMSLVDILRDDLIGTIPKYDEQVLRNIASIMSRHMSIVCQCDTCKHSLSYWVKVGDCSYGNDVEEWDCARSDDPRMLDTETVDGLAPEERGECPCYEPRGSEE